MVVITAIPIYSISDSAPLLETPWSDEKEVHNIAIDILGRGACDPGEGHGNESFESAFLNSECSIAELRSRYCQLPRAFKPLAIARCLNHISHRWDAGLLDRLLTTCGESARLAIARWKQDRHSIFHRAAELGNLEFFKDAANVVENHCGTGALKPLLTADANGDTPFHLSMHSDNPNLVTFLGNLLVQLGGIPEAVALEPNANGWTPLHKAAMYGSPAVMDALIELIEEFWPDKRRELLSPTPQGLTPLHICVNGLRYIEKGRNCPIAAVLGSERKTESLVTLMLRADEDLILSALGAVDYSKPTEKPGHVHQIVRLFSRVRDEHDLIHALGHGLISWIKFPCMQAFLRARYADPQERLRFLLRFCSHEFAAVFPSESAGHLNAVLEGASSHPAAKLLLEPNSVGHYPEIEAVFLPIMIRLRSQLNAAPPDELPDIQRNYLLLSKLLRSFQLTLTLSECSRPESQLLLPLAHRLIKLSSVSTQQTLCFMLGHHTLADSRSLPVLMEMLAASGGSHCPCLYSIPLAVLEKCGVSRRLLIRIAKHIADADTEYYEGSRKGMAVLRILMQIANHSQLIPQDIEPLLGMLLRRDFYPRLVAIGQLIDFGKSEFLTRRFSYVGGYDPRHIARSCFHDATGLVYIDNFKSRYVDRIQKQRDPDSLITFAAKISYDRQVRAELALLMKWILNGTFHERRYDPDASLHMDTLYTRAPRLRAQLPRLCKDLGPRSAGDDRAPIFNQDLIAQLDKETYPHIHSYLAAKSDPERKAKRATLGRDCHRLHKKKSRSEVEELDYQRLRLQGSLANLFQHKEPKAQLHHLKSAMEIAAGLENTELFRVVLSCAQSDLEKCLKQQGKGFVVSLSDHYWDLLRLGTDVIGSCQALDGQSQVIRALLGYVMNGYVIPIVAKRPGSDKIEARRLLIIGMDINGGQPMLYLEKYYGNHRQELVDGALISMAKEVADHLGLKLYSKLGSGDEKQFRVVDSVSSYIYSDAAQGRQGRCYSFPGKLLYTPAGGSGAASSSSSGAGL